MDRQLRIWGVSLIGLGLFGLLAPSFLQFPRLLDPLWSALAIGLGLIPFWLGHPGLLATYAVFLGAQGLLMAWGWYQSQMSEDTLVLAVGILLLVYALRLGGEFRRARRLPVGPADGFALAGIAAAFVGLILSGVALLASPLLMVLLRLAGLHFAIMAAGLSLGALLTWTQRPGLGKLSLGVSLLVLVGTVVALLTVAG